MTSELVAQIALQGCASAFTPEPTQCHLEPSAEDRAFGNITKDVPQIEEDRRILSCSQCGWLQAAGIRIIKRKRLALIVQARAVPAPQGRHESQACDIRVGPQPVTRGGQDEL